MKLQTTRNNYQGKCPTKFKHTTSMPKVQEKVMIFQGQDQLASLWRISSQSLHNIITLFVVMIA